MGKDISFILIVVLLVPAIFVYVGIKIKKDFLCLTPGYL
jgi:hypothetical protein